MDNFKDLGNLARDPELRYTAGDGIPVCTFTIACNTGRGEEADFYDCTAWRKQAENVAAYLKKGSGALVSGRLKISSYTEKDGIKRKKAEIDGCTVVFVGKKE
jgi:single-strand DNA-binding protein